MKPIARFAALTLFLAGAVGLSAAEDILVADFESAEYGAWKATGNAFGAGPAAGTLPGQMRVEGFAGKRLVSSFVGGDKSTGTLTSPSFQVERHYISFLIGGGGFSNETCMNLLLNGKAVRSATGPNIKSGGSENLAPASWDVSDFAGREVTIEIVDRATGGWGHINVDQIIQTDRKPAQELRDVTREIAVEKRYLHFPVKNGGARKKVDVLRDEKVERFFDIELADGEPDWWAFLDVGTWRGEKLTVKVNKLREDSRALASISQDEGIRGAESFYRETLRPQLHFSARRGWLNDPNGLVFYKGEYHLFFQHNPYGWNWGNMHWGHAVSRDLLRWEEKAEALYPDAMGPMFSGSAVVDWKNTSGFGKDGEPPLVLSYTAAGDPAVQCLAYSTDGGRTFTKYSGNPVVKQITGGNRDPKIIWHAPTQRWVIVLYVGFDEQRDGKKTTRHTIHFLNSPNLKDWTVTSQMDGFFECPDLFALPIDGDPTKTKWILTPASAEYMLGTFDGLTFTPETPKLPGHHGKGFYAAQTFSDVPDGRRIQIGWLQAPSPGMAFNQCMSLPHELKLVSTSGGPRMTRTIVPLGSLQAGSATSLSIAPDEEKVLAKNSSGLLKLTADFEPGADSELTFVVNGVPITYSAAKHEISVKGHRAPAPLRDGKQTLTVIADRTALEIFASDGLAYLPVPAIWNTNALGITVSLKGAALKSQAIGASEMSSIWK